MQEGWITRKIGETVKYMSRILMIGSCNFITTHNDGGRQGSYSNYEILRRIFGKENVDLCLITNDSVEKENIVTVPSYRNRLEQIGCALLGRNGYTLKTEKKILKMINEGEYQYVWVDRSTLGGLCKKINNNIIKIVFFHNVEREYIKNKIRHESIGYLFAYYAFLKNEKEATTYADLMVTLNRRDQDMIEKEYKRKADFLMPVSFEDEYIEGSNDDSPYEENGKRILLFVGSFFGPNIEGVQWLVDHVMPKLPECCLYIVGKGMEVKKREWTKFNVHVVGTVECLRPYYLYADAVVLPIFYGDGMKVKTAEALMFGKVIFGTEEAFEGYQEEKLPDLILCKEASEFVVKIRKYLENVNEAKFSERNREYFLKYHENTAIENRMIEFLKQNR